LNDREFIERLRKKDLAAVRHLSECLLPSVWRFVYFRAKGDRHLAEDIASETVLSLIKAVATPDVDVLCPSAWMRSVASHKIQDHYRAVARVQHLIDQADSIAGPNQPIQVACEAEERREAIRKVLDDLPETHRLALEWKYVDQLSVQEIATRMSITEKSVESILFRARREFREGLGVLNREDVPFRLNGKSKPAGQNALNDERGRESLAGLIPDEPPTNVMANQPAGLDEEKRQS
jgi:RNA polymerase sigma factor (sigma-70 family)